MKTALSGNIAFITKTMPLWILFSLLGNDKDKADDNDDILDDDNVEDFILKLYNISI